METHRFWEGNGNALENDNETNNKKGRLNEN
jgi:hypothetical protein